MSFAVSLRDIQHSYLKNSSSIPITFDIEAGNSIFLVGNSGTGKSTLLEIIAGIVSPENGTVIWNTHDIHTSSRVLYASLSMRCSIVFQQHALISYLPLFENVALPLRHHRIGTKSEIDSKVTEILESFNLLDVAWNLPEALSSGERKLGSIARAKCFEPELLCIDDPFGGLDTEQRILLSQFLDGVINDPQITVVIATCDSALLQYSKVKTWNLNEGVLDEIKS